MPYHDIHPAEVAPLRAEPGLLVFDMRDADSYTRGHLDGAQPLSDAVLRQLAKQRRSQPPVLKYLRAAQPG